MGKYLYAKKIMENNFPIGFKVYILKIFLIFKNDVIMKFNRFYKSVVPGFITAFTPCRGLFCVILLDIPFVAFSCIR